MPIKTSVPSQTALAIAEILKNAYRGGETPTIRVNDGPPLQPAEWVQHMMNNHFREILVALRGSEAILKQLREAGQPVQVELREVQDAIRLTGAP